MASIPAIVALDGRYRARGLRALSATPLPRTPEDRAEVEQIIRDQRMQYPCYLDEGSVWSRATGLMPSPVFVIVGRDGREVFRHRGEVLENTPAFEQLAQAIERALAVPAPSSTK